ncbi:DNA-binding transcriptional regulator, XRE-family HTH domain [Propionispira arboris]|uniref:DNA-binding transcriptional regulator, XRE-family HTH domain n=1 Tax=Propionispira arboris TaxID=84035 RepID=A0A1H7CX47_9FIRM|nr:helix-turn-helix transcriptional regulator [Propionispira arboris]SEJ94169.1 DNA-binding transcriptional regulator, XRE-family HTH domain [Propionispira arboris]
MSIGEKLRQLRSDKNLTQKNLADILHITRTTYVKYETDSIKLSFEKASKLADFFNITTDYLLENKHETVPTLETDLPPIDLINVLDHTEIVFDGITYKLNNSSRKKIIDSLKDVFLSIQKQSTAQ